MGILENFANVSAMSVILVVVWSFATLLPAALLGYAAGGLVGGVFLVADAIRILRRRLGGR